MRKPILDMFHRMDMIKGVLSKSAKDAKRARTKASRRIHQINAKGWRNKYNKCFSCLEQLILEPMIEVE